MPLYRPALLLLALGGLVGHALAFNFINDDAFISFRYADNLVRHGELVFNVGERVEGYTNFLWTLLMAGVMALKLDPVPWSKALGVVFGALTLLVLYRHTGRRADRGPGDALAPMLLAAAPAYACWCTGGLETQLFTFLVTLSWTAWLDEQRRSPGEGGLPLSGVWLGLSALARPEGMLFFGLIGLHRLMGLIRAKQMPLKRDWIWGGLFAAVFVPYFIWRWQYYGYPLPNTYYVKTGATGFWTPGFHYFWSWVTTHHLWIIPLLMVIRRRDEPAGHRAHGLVALLAIGLSVHVMRVGGDFMALHRFLVPVMPLLAVAAADGLRALWATLREAGQRLPAMVAASTLAVAGLIYGVVETDRAALKVGSEGGVDSIGWLDMFAGQCAAIGKHLGETADPDASLATTAAGIIPYYSRLYTLDVLGLNDAWIAHNVPPRGHRPGHTRVAPLDYILKKEIDYLIYHPTISKRRPGQGQGARRSWGGRGYEWKTTEVPGLSPPWWGYWQKKAGSGG